MPRTTSPKRKLISLSESQRYALADAIADSYGAMDPIQVQDNAKYIYGVVRNKAQFPITRNGKQEYATLASDCDEDTAAHVTRLVMRRLTQPRLVQRTIASLDLGGE